MVAVLEPGVERMAPAGAMPSLVTPRGITHTSDPPAGGDSVDRDRCPGGSVFQEKCGHGNWRWIWKPCDKWTCDVCREDKLFGELVPELLKALDEARRQRVTLKLLTLTWRGSSLGAQATPEGAERRRLDQQHLIQWLKRRGYLPQKGEVFYLRVAELHKRGTIHLHLYVVMPYVAHVELKEAWRTITGGSFIIDVQPVYLRCPRCWVKGQTRREKRRRCITPWPGNGKCSDCGFGAFVGLNTLARGIAVEAGKYLAKDGSEGVKKKLTRSGSTHQHCPDCDARLVHPVLEWQVSRFVPYSLVEIRYTGKKWHVLREYLGAAVDIKPVRDLENWFCPECSCPVEHPVVRATGWARFRSELQQAGVDQEGKSFCDACEDEHGYTYVGTRVAVEADFSGLELVIAVNGGRGVGWVRAGGQPCCCWGDQLMWEQSQGDAQVGLGDLAGLTWAEP